LGAAIQRRVRERAAGIARRARQRAAAARPRVREAVEERLSDDSGDRRDSPRPDRRAEASRDAPTVSIASDPAACGSFPGAGTCSSVGALVRSYTPIPRPGRAVVLELLLRDGSYTEVDRTWTNEDGKFYLHWYPSRPGYFRVRVRPVNPAAGLPSYTRLL
jgi:hypothetical protein